MMEKYVELVQIARNLMHKYGLNDLDPIVRSIYRKAYSYWKKLSDEDKGLADFWVSGLEPYDLVYDTSR